MRLHQHREGGRRAEEGGGRGRGGEGEEEDGVGGRAGGTVGGTGERGAAEHLQPPPDGADAPDEPIVSEDARMMTQM